MGSGDLKTVVVAGDVVVDWYFWRRYVNPSNKDYNVHWKYFNGYNRRPQLGGAIHISEVLKNIARNNKLDINIIDQDPKKPKNGVESELWDSRLYNPELTIHTNIKLRLFPKDLDSKDKTFRVKDFLGFTTPPMKDDRGYPDPWPINEYVDKADFVIIHDMGNGFREEEKYWPKEIKENCGPIIIYYMNLPLFKGKLWDNIIKHYREQLILILDVEDLRRIGVKISRSLSWEKTALEFLWGIKSHEKLAPIKDLSNVIIRFGLEGAIHYRGDKDKIKSILYFDPASVEGGFWDSKSFGTMKGVSAVFISSVAFELIKSSNETISIKDINKGIKCGLVRSREFMEKGHGCIKKDNRCNYEGEPMFFKDIYNNLFESKDEHGNEKVCKEGEDNHIDFVDLPSADYSKEPPFWSILEKRTKGKDEDLKGIAKEIVKRGYSALKKCPIGKFGKLVAVDTAEIENYRSIMNVMEGYINSEKTIRPLSFAVFGNPGSGKTFAIKQIAEEVDSEKIQYREFNVSQFTSVEDLTSAFHSIRDISLEGKVPLAFFDEFDCSFKDQRLGWLRYFLVPMQEGKFMDYGSFHPIGKSIFVFAGGVYENFKQFCADTGIGSNDQKDENQNSMANKSSIEKCPDFVSRLRGYVNILGPNEVKKDKDKDNAYIIRRAIILRSLIEQKMPKIITEDNSNDIKNGEANIDENLLDFLLIKVSKYKHGARSMEAILDMSILKGGKYFGIKEENYWGMASLPSKDQLDLHIEEHKS